MKLISFFWYINVIKTEWENDNGHNFIHQKRTVAQWQPFSSVFRALHPALGLKLSLCYPCVPMSCHTRVWLEISVKPTANKGESFSDWAAALWLSVIILESKCNKWRHAHQRWKWVYKFRGSPLTGRLPLTCLHSWDSFKHLPFHPSQTPHPPTSSFLNKEPDQRQAASKAPLPKLPSIYSLFSLICYTSTTLKNFYPFQQLRFCSFPFPTLQLSCDKPHFTVRLFGLKANQFLFTGGPV